MRNARSIAIRFEKEYLHSLVQDENSCVKLEEYNYHIALHPFHLNNINESIKDILSGGIAKYNSTFGGILLGYQNIKLLSSAGAINNDTCFIHLDISAEFFIFKPEVGKILSGIVNKKSQDHVGCLVYKTFNVSLPKPEDDEEWMGFSANVGQVILFCITFIDLEGRLPYIRAAFVSIISDQDSGISTGEESNKKPLGKPKRIVFGSESEAEPEEQEPIKSKKKRKNTNIANNENGTLDSSVITSSFSNKKRKRKRNESVTEKSNENFEESINEQGTKINNHSYNLTNDNEYSSPMKKKKKKKLDHSDKEESSLYIHDLKNVTRESNDSYLKNKYKSESQDSVDSKTVHKKTRKRKHEMSNDDSNNVESVEHLQQLLMNETLQNISGSDGMKPKNKYNRVEHEMDTIEDVKSFKSTKHKKSKADVSLSDINLPEFFNESNVTSTNKQLLKNNRKTKEDKVKVKTESKSLRKTKHKDSLEGIQNELLNKVLLNFNEDNDKTKLNTQKIANKSKSKSKRVKTEMDITIPDLNLSNLFNDDTSINWQSNNNLSMADNEDRSFKKRSSLTSISVSCSDTNLELLHNSDIESLLGDSKKKHKKVKRETFNDSSDEFEVPRKKANLKNS